MLAGAASWGSAMRLADAAARPSRSSTAIQLRLALDWEGLPTAGLRINSIMEQVFAPFTAARRGVRVTTTLGNCSNAPSNFNYPDYVGQIIAGGGVDVLASCGGTAAALVTQGVLLPLDAYLARDNVPLSTWPATTVESFRFGRGLYYLPSEVQPRVLVVNVGVLNQLGLAVPAPGWSYKDADKIWRSVAGKVGGKARLGAMLPLPHSIETWAYVAAGFGGRFQNADYTRATFSSSPEVVAGGRWLVEDLVWPGVVQRGSVYNHPGPFAAGQVVFSDAPSWCLPVVATALHGTDWRFIPYPRFPAGNATMDSGNALGISVASKHVELAWELLQYICVNPEYWRRYARVSMSTPSQTALWPEWERAIEAVAPDLRDKGLNYYTQSVASGWGYPGHPFAYGDDQCENIIDTWSEKAIAHKMSVSEACARMDHAVNAYLAVAAPQEARMAAAARATETQLTAAAAKPSTVFAPPPRAGAGVAAASAAPLVRIRSGAYTVQGSLGDLTGTADGGTFTAAALTASHATLTCRVVQLTSSASVKASAGAAIGLMVRGDLSDDAAMAVLAIVPGKGVTLLSRESPGQSSQVTPPPSGATSVGLVSARYLVRPAAAPGRNLLLRPLWLRLMRDVATWTAYTSPDGAHWTPAGPPSVLQAAGAWAGLLVADSPQARVTAAFDHVAGFAPKTPVRLR